jgi:ABC-type phosphate transport system substrate-binding protein
MQFLRQRRRGAVIVGAALGASAMAAVLAAPAGASTSPAANNIIIGSGSAAAYTTLVGLGGLFNGSPGCNLVVASGGTQQQDFSCASPPGPGFENGYATSGNNNPFNDVALQEPPLGANAGILQLEDQGTHNGSGVTTAPISYASSSRAAQSTDLKGLNLVAYAKDGLSWFHFTKVNKKATPSSKVTNLTVTQLTGIWNGTITNWNQVGGTNAPIVVYVANKSAGTESVWKSALGITDVPPGVTDPSHVIFQNDDSSIISQGNANDAIYYYSYGFYSGHCPKGICQGNKKYVTALGSINGVAPTPTTILNNTFPITRYLYTVYSNGSNSNIPTASQATLNFASEDGFLCKAQNDTNVDPITGATYRSEINADISAQGFIPLPKGSEGSVTHPANITDPGYSAIDMSGTNPTGYCLVTTTDGNANS